MEIPRNIFRNYDIRGTYPDELNAHTAKLIGKVLGTHLWKKGFNRIVVGRDDRASSPELSKALIKGITSTGCHVTDTGISITPAIHFLTSTQNFDMGVVVTASHNPKEFNGFRIDYRHAKQFYGDLVMMLRFMIEREEFVTGEGTVTEEDMNHLYIDYLAEKFKFKPDIKVVVDCGSGATSEIATKIFEKTGANIIPVHCTYDSNFPDGVPDPESSVLMEELREHVLKNKADVGFAYDTDGDRFGMVDEKGTAYKTDMSLLLFAEHVLKKNPGRIVCFDVKCSSIVEEHIRKLGGVPKIMRTGHPYFVNEVQGDAVLGAEFSGHVYFSDDYFGYDDGVYASCRALEILHKEKKSLSELMSKYPTRAATREIKVPCDDNEKFKVVNLVKIYLMNNVKYQKIIDIDGVRANITDTGWFLIRASNTTPNLSIRAEGKDEKEKEELLEIVRKALKSVSIVELDINF
ncbi:phosphomannomutase/phosphoglucomutase [Patescibacteria group bacterium]